MRLTTKHVQITGKPHQQDSSRCATCTQHWCRLQAPDTAPWCGKEDGLIVILIPYGEHIDSAPPWFCLMMVGTVNLTLLLPARSVPTMRSLQALQQQA
jgi:hypothetical protein